MIRLLTRADIEPFFFLIQRNRHRLQNYFPMTVNSTGNISSTRVYVEQKLLEAAKQEFMLFMVHNQEGQLVGVMQAKNFDRHIQKCEVGYFIDEMHVNRGYATRAMESLLRFLFTNQKLEKVYCRIDPDNKASIRIAEKLGFALEGRLRQEFQTGTGQIIDILYYGIFRKDFLKAG